MPGFFQAQASLLQRTRLRPRAGLSTVITLRLLLGFALTSASLPSVAGTDQLVYISAPDCTACQQFDAEVGPSYSQTLEGRLLPMTRIKLSDWRAGTHPLSQCVDTPVVGTPTFIYLRGCGELDRIYGYSSDELFWMALRRMLDNAAPAALSDLSH